MGLTTVHKRNSSSDDGGRGIVAPPSPTVARWDLSIRLRERRRDLGVDVKAITDHLRFSRNYWSAVERDRTLLAKDKLEALFDVLEFDDDEKVELRRLREAARQRGWWMDYPALQDAIEDQDLLRLVGLEAGAEHVQTYEGTVITGLLQTKEYARELITTDPAVSPIHVEQLLEVRKRRQDRLWAQDPLKLSTVMSQAALLQEIGGAAIQYRQLQHLVSAAKELGDSLELRIVPFNATPLGMIGSSTLYLLHFVGKRLPMVAFQEAAAPIGFVDDAERLRFLKLSYDRATKSALSHDDSIELIQKIASESGN